MLRHAKVVILDEATSNIDVVTEQRIMKLMQEEFKDATVITIAHRLNTIIKSDRICVIGKDQAMEYDENKEEEVPRASRVLEYDSPQVLSARPDSELREFCDKARDAETQPQANSLYIRHQCQCDGRWFSP